MFNKIDKLSTIDPKLSTSQGFFPKKCSSRIHLTTSMDNVQTFPMFKIFKICEIFRKPWIVYYTIF